MKRTSRPCSGSIRTPVYSEAYPVLASDSLPKYSRNGAIIVTNMRRSIVYKPLQEHPQLPSKAVNTLKLADGHPALNRFEMPSMSLLGVRCDGNRGHENTTTANAKKEKPIMSLFDPWLTTGSGLSLPCGKRGQRIIRQYSVKLKQNITKI